GARLPSVRELAAEAGVSHFTLSKALRILCREGVVDARPRAGIVVRSPARSPERVVEEHTRLAARWEQIALVLGRRLRSTGANPLRGQILPKQVCIEFGVSYQTARKAIDHLVANNILVPYSRGFVAVGTQGYGGMSVLCTTRSSRVYGTVDEERITRVFSNQFERVCAQERVPLEYVFLTYDENGIAGIDEAGMRLRQVARRRPRTLALVQTAGLDQTAVSRLCTLFQSARVPVAVVDFGNGLDLSKLPRYRLGYAHVAATSRPGETMGDFLVDNGYRRIGVIALAPNDGWQEQRLAGIISRVSQRSSDVTFYEYQVAQSRHEEPGIGSFAPSMLADGSVEYPRLLGQMQTDAERAAGQYRLRRQMHPLLREAVQRDKPDILVGLNDSIAVAALDVLYSLGVDVPGQCAVAGFDDSPAAFAAHLSSYNFNWHALSRELLRFGYTCSERLNKPSHLGVDGYVVERMTTATIP
ncbi:MAG: GntR family transcriptional regulator, partial [Chitinivibrionales bacterium]|nr:GntR family transcriptional regulator [Chitinivibrionales bacterium]